VDTPLDALRAFAKGAPAWICGDAKTFAMEVEYQLVDESGGAFKRRRVKYADGAAIFECEWLRLGGTLADLYRDFYAAYGDGVCEDAQFIQCSVVDKTVVFNVVVGSAGHVHLLQMRVVGPHVEQAIARPQTSGRHGRGRGGR
jgi:hypothetical protein